MYHHLVGIIICHSDAYLGVAHWQLLQNNKLLRNGVARGMEEKNENYEIFRFRKVPIYYFF